MSFFKFDNKQKLSFSELPFPVQKSLVWRWAIECENSLDEKISHLLSSNPKDPSDLSESTWLQIIAIGNVHFGPAIFQYFELPTEAVKKVILTHHEEISEDWDSWDEYKAFYGTEEIPQHSEDNRFPCLAPTGEPEIFEDGWHRLHSYINQGHLTIPILEY